MQDEYNEKSLALLQSLLDLVVMVCRKISESFQTLLLGLFVVLV